MFPGFRYFQTKQFKSVPPSLWTKLKYAPLHKTVNERTSSEAGASPTILKISNKANGAEFHHRITRVAPSNSFSKDNLNSQPQTQKKGRPSMIDYFIFLLFSIVFLGVGKMGGPGTRPRTRSTFINLKIC